MIRLIGGPAGGLEVEDDYEPMSKDRMSIWYPSAAGDLLYRRGHEDFEEVIFECIDHGGWKAESMRWPTCDQIHAKEETGELWKLTLET